MLVCALKDVKAEAFAQPFFVATVAVARRAMEKAVSDPESDVHRFPADYELYVLGEFDERSGILVGFESPRFVDKGTDYALARVG